MSIKKHLAVLAATAVAVGTLFTGSAVADVSTVLDAKNDTMGGADIWRVKVTHEKRVRVDIKFKNLVPAFQSGASASIFVDTDKATAGPEFVLGTGLFEGTDYAMFRAEAWKSVGEPLTCFHKVTLDYDRDVAHVVFGRGCLGTPDAVRVAVKAASEHMGDVHVDWLKGFRKFTPWVSQG
jgi:hypothetical protein